MVASTRDHLIPLRTRRSPVKYHEVLVDNESESSEERRGKGLLRVPFVRRCLLAYEDGLEDSGFIVNINVMGAYVTAGRMPPLGAGVTCSFGLPGTERQITAKGIVTWLNPNQQHPVHSLPAGFGIKFDNLEREARTGIEDVVDAYAARRSDLR